MSDDVSPKWDVYRDADGNPVTLTPEQVAAVIHAVTVRDQVIEAEGVEDAEQRPFFLSKSRLLGRMLIDGRPPLAEKPPNVMGACGYHEVEPDLHHWYWHGSPPDDECQTCHRRVGHHPWCREVQS